MSTDAETLMKRKPTKLIGRFWMYFVILRYERKAALSLTPYGRKAALFLL